MFRRKLSVAIKNTSVALLRAEQPRVQRGMEMLPAGLEPQLCPLSSPFSIHLILTQAVAALSGGWQLRKFQISDFFFFCLKTTVLTWAERFFLQYLPKPLNSQKLPSALVLLPQLQHPWRGWSSLSWGLPEHSSVCSRGRTGMGMGQINELVIDWGAAAKPNVPNSAERQLPFPSPSEVSSPCQFADRISIVWYLAHLGIYCELMLSVFCPSDTDRRCGRTIRARSLLHAASKCGKTLESSDVGEPCLSWSDPEWHWHPLTSPWNKCCLGKTPRSG